MNKKFTMMLAAFLAAGYTITAEAGVVKVTSPKAGNSYIITNVPQGQEALLYLSANGLTDSNNDAAKAEAAANIEALASVTEVWKLEGSSLESVTIKNKAASNGLNASFQFATTPASDFKVTSTTIMNGSNYLTFPASAGTVSAGTEVAKVAFYAKGTQIDVTADNAVKIGDKYLSIENGNVVLKSLKDYACMSQPTVWTVTSGVLSSGGKELLITEEGAKLVEDGGSVLEVIEGADAKSGTLTVTTEDGLNMYVTADLKTSAKASAAVAYDGEAGVVFGGIVPSKLGVSNEENVYAGAVTSLSGNFRLVAYSAIGTDGKMKFIYSENGTVKQTAEATDESKYEEASNTKNFYWSYSGGAFTNVNGGKLYTANVYPVYATDNSGNKISNAFYLVTVEGQYLKLDENGGFTLTVAGTPTDATLFSVLPSTDSDYPVEDLNKVTEGAFSVTYKYGENTAENNPFENVTAIEIPKTGKYEAGIYFAVDAPANAVTKDEWTEAELDKLTFVAVNPSKFYFEDNTTNGSGAEFVTKKGSELVAADKASKDKVATCNAVFDIRKSDYNVEKLIFTITGAKFYNSTADAMSTAGLLYVTAAKDGSEYVVTTAAERTDYIFATLGSENIVDFEDFLKSERQVFNIQFMSTKLANDGKDKTQSEYKKYLGLGAEDLSVLLAQGADFVDLNAPQNQWVVSNMTKENVVTFKNREGGQEFSAKLVKTEEGEDIYRLTGVDAEEDILRCKYVPTYGGVGYTDITTIQNNMLIKLVPATVDMMAGYASDELDNIGLVKMSFNIDNPTTAIKLYLNATGYGVYGHEDQEEIALNKDKSSQFEIVKFKADTIFYTNKYAYLNEKKEIKQEDDKLAVVTYAFKQYRTDGQSAFLNSDLKSVTLLSEGETAEDDAQRFLIKINKDGSHSLIPVTNVETQKFDDLVNSEATTYDINNNAAIFYSNIYADHNSKFLIEGEAWNASYNHVPQHVMFQNGNSYMAVNEAGAAIMEAPSALKAEYTKADLTFWLDTTDNKAAVPTFYISKGAKEYMFNAKDSLTAYNEGTASIEDVKEYIMPGFENYSPEYAEPRAIFRAATLKDSKTLVTSIDGKETELTKAEDLANYQYKIVLKDEAADDEYVVRSLNGYSYLYETNGQLGFTGSKDKAIVFTIERVEAPTSNESVSASEVKVIANNGSVVVKNAAGKNVVVSTILGQVVANEVLTSDNATINVPAGIVVVAVEGESFKINVR